MKNPELPDNPDLGSEQSLEEIEQEYVERLIEAALLSGYKIDEGQNAIILEVSPADMIPEVREYFFDGAEAEMPDEYFISKVLKVYNPGESRQEFENQQKAIEIIESQDNQDELAKIPALYREREITITNAELKEKLETGGIDMSKDKVGVILMYKIQGMDMLNYLLRKVIETTPDDEIRGHAVVEDLKDTLSEFPDSTDLNQLFKTAGIVAGFEDSDGIWLSPANRDRLLQHLRKNGFVMDEAVMKKIEKTIEILNDNDFYHNDLTERNVMFEVDDDGGIVDVYIIDFEKSSDTENEDFGGDMAIMSDYKKLTKSQEQDAIDRSDAELAKAEKFAARVAKLRPESYITVKSELAKIIQAEDGHILEAGLISNTGAEWNDQWIELFISALLDLYDEEPEAVKSYIAKKRNDPNTHGRYKTMLGKIRF